MEQLFYEKVNGSRPPPPTLWICKRCVKYHHAFYVRFGDEQNCPIDGSPPTTALDEPPQ